MDEAPQRLPEQEITEAEKGEDDDDADWLQLRLARTPPPAALEGRRSTPQTPATTELPLLDGGGPSSSSKAVEPPMRVVSPARSPAGLWFMLQVDRTRGDQRPPLPQIAKSYLRIRDGGMTVRLLMKYIVNKLRLNVEEEAEVEITCRNQVLHPSSTLQYVRDNIWRAREAVLILPDSPNIDHVMRLLYRRRTSGMTR
ncbi:protein LAX PANICLE 2-like [Zingiber officinale]|uniref:protein LAX PANICLE 2-like n=1 Tax=Zingiber officinale TaxID=94328 RepID=UPI001C4AF072|nr:protein LAX PANICLE 2-like [Zingiber officinale]